jgi:lipopolysaccharide/colanic/teichoic acid biosynthesis glycosyltransferase
MTYCFFKRLTDIVISLIAIIIFTPLMLALAILIKLDSPKGGVFYCGERAGRAGTTFRILKFRTMVVDAELKGGFSTATNDPRLIPLGRSLRKYKLDELPQFFNVLFGDMSLVGPRPQVVYYTSRYRGDELLILSVRPGITDLASLHFVDMDAVLGSGDVDVRYQTEIEPLKNQLRIRYVRERSYLMDIRILIETAFKLLGFSNATGLNVTPNKSKANG